VIETPRGSAEKFAFDPEHQSFALKRVLPIGMVFPFDFGFVPGTKADDGDPVDVVVLSEFKSVPGCLVEWDHVKNLDELPGAMLEELEQFFVNYHEQEGTKYEPLDRVSAAQAEKLLAKHQT
jgi:inorganic pyrophosphatase